MTRYLKGVAVVAILALAGCTPGASQNPNPGPYHEWFNPNGDKVGDNIPVVCDSGEVSGLPAVIPPLSAPPGVAEGYSFATIDLTVEALVIKGEGADPVVDLCIPVGVHAYILVGGVAAPITVLDKGGVRVVQTPWDALRNTPYSATGVVAWRNTLVSGPVVSIDWSAKYMAEIDPISRPDTVVGLACSVYSNGVLIARTISLDVDRPNAPLPGAQGGQGVTGPFVSCQPPAFTPRAAL